MSADFIPDPNHSLAYRYAFELTWFCSNVLLDGQTSIRQTPAQVSCVHFQRSSVRPQRLPVLPLRAFRPREPLTIPQRWSLSTPCQGIFCCRSPSRFRRGEPDIIAGFSWPSTACPRKNLSGDPRCPDWPWAGRALCMNAGRVGSPLVEISTADTVVQNRACIHGEHP